jgi:phage replication initiation protein
MLKQNSSALDETAFGSMVQHDAQAAGAPSYEGGTATPQVSPDPRLVIRGESFKGAAEGTPQIEGESYHLHATKHGQLASVAIPYANPEVNSYAAITDFLNCTFPINHEDLEFFFIRLFRILGPSFTPAVNRHKGLHGWESSYSLGNSKAFFAIGGQNGTGFLSLCAESCHMVPDWPALTAFLRDDLQGRITRWDGAVDDFAGTHSVDYAVNLYKNGGFKSGGNQPLCDQAGNWIDPDGQGRTFYVGNRKNGKMLRVYEKGMQLGAIWHPWVRWEVELHNRDRIVPWDVLLTPGKYVAGAYPRALGWLNDEMLRIKTISETTKIGYERLTHYHAMAYGKHINVMLQVEGSAEKVVEKLIREGLPARLDLPVIPDGEGRGT